MAKINGRSSFTKRATITVPIGTKPDGTPDTITAKVKTLGIDVSEKLQERIPEPLPPTRPLRDSQGPIRDKDGQPVMHEDRRDAAYRKAARQHQLLFGIAGFLEALDDPSWQFDSVRPQEGDSEAAWRSYYEHVLEELAQLGLSGTAIMRLAQQIAKLSGIGDPDLEKAASGFLQEPAGTGTSETSSGSSSVPATS